VEHLINCGAILNCLVIARNACEMSNRLSIVAYCNYSIKYDEMAKINSQCDSKLNILGIEFVELFCY
jgi:hypothetical protein